MNLLRNWYNTLTANWQEAFRDRNFRLLFFPNFLACFVLHYSIVYWLRANSGHAGTVVNDPVYGMLNPRDFSPIIFFFTYTSTILIILNIAQYPLLMHRGFLAFVLVFLVRAICIHLIPLSPSPGIVPLQDPVTNWLADENQIMNDLFFSGHVADLTMFALLAQNKKLRIYITFCACIVAILLVWQRVHYTIDVIMAPAFAYTSYYLFVYKDIIWRSFLKSPFPQQTQDHYSMR